MLIKCEARKKIQERVAVSTVVRGCEGDSCEASPESNQEGGLQEGA